MAISGSSIIKIVDKNNVVFNELTIADVYNTYNTQSNLEDLKVRAFDIKTKTFKLTKVRVIIDTGIKPTDNIFLSSGQSLALSKGESIYTTKGWLSFEELKASDYDSLRVYCNGKVAGNGYFLQQHWLKECIELSYTTEQIAEIAETSKSVIERWAFNYKLVLNKGKKRVYANESHPWFTKKLFKIPIPPDRVFNKLLHLPLDIAVHLAKVVKLETGQPTQTYLIDIINGYNNFTANTMAVSNKDY